MASRTCSCSKSDRPFERILQQRELSMIKDLVVNLALEPERDPAAEFALSVASAFSAHAAGIAFQYDPIMPTALMDDVPPDVIDTQRSEEHTSELQSRRDLVCRLLLEKKKK